jgi:Rrf2 family iron-sulfur cluster assembly transcriptional regulator
MLLYTKPSLYAIRALIYIAERKGIGSCLARDIAEAESMPRHYLSKILKDLVGAKILDSNMGPGGGFVLKRPASKISLIHVVQVFDDIHTDLKSCAIGWHRCTDEKPCSLHEKFKPLREEIRDYLTNTTLDQLATADLSKIKVREKAGGLPFRAS